MRKLLLAMPALLLAITVHAQEGKRAYGAIEYGVTRLANQAAEIASDYVGVFGGSAAVTQDTSAGISRLFFGYRLTPQAAVEGGYLSSQKFGARVAGTAGGGAAYTSAIDIEVSGFDASFVWSPMATNYADSGIYLKAGAHSSKIENAISVTGAGGTVTLSSSGSGTGMLFGAGYDWGLSDNAFIRTGATRYLKLGGVSDTKATVYSVAVGISF